MADSPFADFANAVLRFEVASGTLTPDSRGNLRPGKAIVEISAMLQQKRDPNRSNDPGVDSSKILVEGYITAIVGQESLVLPSVVTPDSPCQATWQGRNGQFYMEFAARNPYLAALAIDLVEKVRGYFQPSSFVVSGDLWSPSPTPEPGQVDTTQVKGLTYPASASLSALRVVRLNGSGELEYADSSIAAHAFSVAGILPGAVSSGSSIAPITEGTIADVNWSWTIGQPIFLGANGQLTQAPQSESGFILQVAIPLTATSIDFEIQEPVLL